MDNHVGPRLFFLGAGFSVPAGLPVARDLLPLVLTEVADANGWSHLHRSFDEYQDYVEATMGTRPDPVDIEDFATYLDHQHHFGMLGSDTWSEEGNRDQFLLRWGIGRTLNSRTPRGEDLPQRYRDWAASLRPRDTIVTFNYDLIAERAMEAVGVAYRRFPTRFESVGASYSTVDSSRDDEEVVLLKVHGSVDWLNRASYDRQLDYMYEVQGHEGVAFSRRRALMFGDARVSDSHALLDGPIRPDDGLVQVEVIDNLDSYYSSRAVAYEHPPLVLAPSAAKQLYGHAMRDFWRGMGLGAWGWGGFSIVGCSLPPADPYTKQVLFSVARGYTRGLVDPGYRLGPMSKICVVNLATDDAAISGLHDTYRFLDPAQTDFLLDGFDDAAVVRLSAEPGG